MDADFSSAVCANVVLVRAELAALSRNPFQLLLRGSVGISDLHAHLVVADSHAMVLLDDFLTLVARLKPECVSLADRCVRQAMGRGMTYRAKPTPRLLPMLSRRILLERTWYPTKMAFSSWMTVSTVSGRPSPAHHSHYACTHGLGETLGQVGKVKIGRALITLRLKSSIETLLRIADLELVSINIVP